MAGAGSLMEEGGLDLQPRYHTCRPRVRTGRGRGGDSGTALSIQLSDPARLTRQLCALRNTKHGQGLDHLTSSGSGESRTRRPQ